VVTASTVTEALAIRVFEQEEQILGVRRPWLEQNLLITQDWVNANSELVEWVRPDAGALCVIRLKDSVDLERFRHAAAERGVRLAEGDWFGDESRVFRLGFGFLPAGELKAALDALGEAVHAAH
jgi:DNA-binding transcriptional MocR family regulator